MTDEHLYWRVHLNNGQTWFCQKFGYVKDLIPAMSWPDWVDEEIDYGMTGAILAQYVDCTDSKPSPFVALPCGVCAVEELSVPRLSGYHRSLENHERKLP